MERHFGRAEGGCPVRLARGRVRSAADREGGGVCDTARGESVKTDAWQFNVRVVKRVDCEKGREALIKRADR